jgi:aspartyl protease family protein
MGLTSLVLRVGNPTDPTRFVDLEMLVDSGAGYAIVPADVLLGPGIQPRRRETFRLADGTPISREVAIAGFEHEGHVGGATVIFGEPGDACLVGALALESLGLTLDPVRRALRPVPLLM